MTWTLATRCASLRRRPVDRAGFLGRIRAARGPWNQRRSKPGSPVTPLGKPWRSSPPSSASTHAPCPCIGTGRWWDRRRGLDGQHMVDVVALYEAGWSSLRLARRLAW